MLSTSLFLLLGAAAAVAILHSILPDHWVPLAIVARTQHWSMMRTVRVSALAATGHVIVSLILGGIVALIGLQFQRELDTQQGHIIGGILILTGIAFLIWGLRGGGHRHGDGGHTHHHGFEHKPTHAETHEHSEHHHAHTHDHSHKHEEHHHDHEGQEPIQKTTAPARKPIFPGRLAAIVVPFGVAASPDLTILPVALAASASGATTVLSVLAVFAILTLATFIGLTAIATVVGYQIKGAWIEHNANTITSFVLIAIGVVAFIGF